MAIKEKEYSYEIHITFACLQHAKSKKELIEQVKEDFFQEYGIKLTDEEITNIEIMEKNNGRS